MKRLSKRGSISLLVEILVIIGVIALIFFVVVKLSAHADESTQEILCRSSVILRGQASATVIKGLIEFEKVTPLACHTQELGKIKGSREDVKRQIADYSAKCWWQFAEGSVKDIFKTDKKEQTCFVCYTFTIKDGLDKGKLSRSEAYPEELSARDSTIKAQELSNFLISESYNPGIIYGGGTKNYFGMNYIYGIDAGIKDEADTINPSRIDYLEINGYTLDYSNVITSETSGKINELGAKLQEAGAGSMLVVVADEFKSLENSDARTLIENTKLNSNDSNYDAILFMVDLKKQTIRIHLGTDQSAFIKDYELNDIAEQSFKNAIKECQTKDDIACNKAAINKGLQTTVEKISDKLLNAEGVLMGISPDSYYYYTTNGGISWTILTDVEPKKTYAIAYVSPTDEKPWTVSAKATTGTGAIIGGVLAVGIVVVSGGAALPAVLLFAGTAGAGAGAVGGYAGGNAAGAYDKMERTNTLVVMQIDQLGEQCITAE